MVISKDFSTLVPDIYNLLDGESLLTSVEKFKDDLGKMLLRRFEKEQEKREPSLRLSSIGRPLRQQWYDLNGYAGETLTGKTKFKFLYGDLIELIVLFLAEASGHTVERFQEEVTLEGVTGHIDAVIDGVLCDVKSCSPYSFEKFVSGEFKTNDPFGYVPQLSSYGQALGFKKAAFIAVDKTIGNIATVEIDPYEYNAIGRIQEVRSAVAQSTPPERCYSDEPDGKSGNRKLAIGCSYCAHKFTCWADSNGGKGVQVYYYANGPRYLTKVVREPKVSNALDQQEVQPMIPSVFSVKES